MSAVDSCEPQVIRALEKDGWHILQKPFRIRITVERTVFADLCLQKPANGIRKQILIMKISAAAQLISDAGVKIVTINLESEEVVRWMR
jgi:hypothetical protein